MKKVLANLWSTPLILKINLFTINLKALKKYVNLKDNQKAVFLT